MSIEKGDIIKAYIKGETENGTLFFSNANTLPVEFCVGSNFFLKGIEHIVVGMEKGEKKDAVLSPEDSFGYKTNELIKIIPRGFHEQEMEEGDMVTYFDYKRKKPMDGVVITSHPKTLVVDFNHSLCGKTIKYDVEVVDIVKKGRRNKEDQADMNNQNNENSSNTRSNVSGESVDNKQNKEAFLS
jgi:FKBP-type peptidyl-prolyl cis-trans isomerase SlpA